MRVKVKGLYPKMNCQRGSTLALLLRVEKYTKT